MADKQIREYPEQTTVDNSDMILMQDGVSYEYKHALPSSLQRFGEVVNFAASTSVSAGATTATIGFDNTIPQISEGTEFGSVTITPTSGTNVLCIEVTAFATRSAAGNATAALFIGATADAVAAVPLRFESADASATITLRHYMIAGSTASKTFTWRAGPTSGTLTVNGRASGEWYGVGVTKSVFTVTEIKKA